MAVSLTRRWILPLTPPVRATNVQQPSAQQGSNGHGRTVVTHTGPPVVLTGGIPKLATLVPDLSPTPCTPCAPSRWILAASTQPRAPGETRADLGVKGSQVQILSARPRIAAGQGPFQSNGGRSRVPSRHRLTTVLDHHQPSKAVPRPSSARPGEHRGASHKSSASGSHPHTGTWDQPVPGPASTTLPATGPARKTNDSSHLDPAS